MVRLASHMSSNTSGEMYAVEANFASSAKIFVLDFISLGFPFSQNSLPIRDHTPSLSAFDSVSFDPMKLI